MNEKSLSVLENYDLQIESTYRSKGNYGCVTKEERYILQEYNNSNEKMFTMNTLYKHLEDNGFVVDSVIPNKDGEYISVSEDGYTYILKKWFEGRECDISSKEDVIKGTTELAKWHKACSNTTKLWENAKGFHPGRNMIDAFTKHNKEIINIRNYIKKRRNKNYFEMFLQKIIDEYYEQGREALENLKNSEYQEKYNSAVNKCTLNYGNFNHHSFLFQEDRVVLINMSKISYAPQIQDLYDYLRKVMEKMDWDIELGNNIIDQYHRVNSLNKSDIEILKIFLSYPEKFWKVINYYYNSNKAWYSEKNEEKLIQFSQQEEKRWDFIRNMK